MKKTNHGLAVRQIKSPKTAAVKHPLTKLQKDALYEQFKARLLKELIPVMTDVSICAYYEHIDRSANPSFAGITTGTGYDLLKRWRRTRYSKSFEAQLSERMKARLAWYLKPIEKDIAKEEPKKGGVK